MKAKGIVAQDPKKYNKAWIVFDRDRFQGSGHKDVEKAYRLADKEGFEIAYSDSCFEHWVLLHFEDCTNCGSYQSKDYEKRLQEKYIPAYKKNLPNLYELLQEDRH